MTDLHRVQIGPAAGLRGIVHGMNGADDTGADALDDVAAGATPCDAARERVFIRHTALATNGGSLPRSRGR